MNQHDRNQASLDFLKKIKGDRRQESANARGTAWGPASLPISSGLVFATPTLDAPLDGLFEPDDVSSMATLKAQAKFLSWGDNLRMHPIELIPELESPDTIYFRFVKNPQN